MICWKKPECYQHEIPPRWLVYQYRSRLPANPLRAWPLPTGGELPTACTWVWWGQCVFISDNICTVFPQDFPAVALFGRVRCSPERRIAKHPRLIRKLPWITECVPRDGIARCAASPNPNPQSRFTASVPYVASLDVGLRRWNFFHKFAALLRR